MHLADAENQHPQRKHILSCRFKFSCLKFLVWIQRLYDIWHMVGLGIFVFLNNMIRLVYDPFDHSAQSILSWVNIWQNPKQLYIHKLDGLWIWTCKHMQRFFPSFLSGLFSSLSLLGKSVWLCNSMWNNSVVCFGGFINVRRCESVRLAISKFLHGMHQEPLNCFGWFDFSVVL